MTLAVAVAEIVERSSDPLLAVADGWARVALREVADVLNGFAFKSEAFNSARGMPLIRIRDILTDHTDCLYDGEYEPVYLVEPGDLLIGMDGDFNCARWQGPRALLNQRVCKLIPKTDLYDHRFLEIVLPGYLKAINESTPSSTVKHLSSASVLDIPLPLPPLAEQRRIVAQVEALLARVSASRERLAKVPAILKRFRQAVLAAACSGHLTQDWRDLNPDAEPASQLLQRVLAERQRVWQAAESGRYREPESLDLTDLPDLPEKWTWASLASVTRRIADADHKMPSGVPDGVPYVSTRDFAGEAEIDLANAKRISRGNFAALTRKIKPELGDILLSRYGTVGLVRMVMTAEPFQASYSIAIVKTLPELPLADYLVLTLRSELLQRQMKRDIRASSQPDLGLDYIRRFAIPLPPLPEQREIARRTAVLLDLTRKIEQRIAAATLRADKLTQSILARAFRGELVPIEAELARVEERDYEPASVLLERIRRQRESRRPVQSRRGKTAPRQLSLLAR